MSINKVTAGDNVPHEFNVIIEIPMNADPVKYEIDKESGALFVDRFMMTAMHYPANYGYVPQTIGDVPDIRLRQIQHFFEHYKDSRGRQVGQGHRLGGTRCRPRRTPGWRQAVFRARQVTGRRLRTPRPAVELDIHQPRLELAAYSAAKRGLSI